MATVCLLRYQYAELISISITLTRTPTRFYVSATYRIEGRRAATSMARLKRAERRV